MSIAKKLDTRDKKQKYKWSKLVKNTLKIKIKAKQMPQVLVKKIDYQFPCDIQPSPVIKDVKKSKSNIKK